jgi:hypothetical protein
LKKIKPAASGSAGIIAVQIIRKKDLVFDLQAPLSAK